MRDEKREPRSERIKNENREDGINITVIRIGILSIYKLTTKAIWIKI